MIFNHKQLIFAREYRGYSQTELASHIQGLSQSNLSKFEKGIGILSDDVKKRIIDFLGFPEDFYTVNISNNVENAHYRRKSGISKGVRDYIEYSNKLIGYIIDEMSDSVEFPDLQLKTLDLEEGYSPEYAAQFTRKFLSLKEEPVKDIYTILENAGIIIVEEDLDVDSFDGVSFMTDKGFYVMIINKNFSNDHKRFTIAHELGHMVMHLSNKYPIPNYRDKEDEAHRFASEFLMPQSAIKRSLQDLKLSYAASLKSYWLTSMASIIRRAKDLNCITKEKYRYFNVELSRKGYKKDEPINVYIDKPTSFYDAYLLFKNELNYSDLDLANAFKLPIDIINKYFVAPQNKVKFKLLK